MDFGIYAGDTSKTIYVRLRDATTGLAKTGLVFNSAGVDASYTLPGAASVPITLITLASASAGWASGGFILVNDTDAKGLYRLDLPDAAIASGAFSIISIEFDDTIEESVEVELHVRDVNVIQVAGTAQSAGDIVDEVRGIGTAGGAAISVDANTSNEGGGISGVTSGTTIIGTPTNTFTSTSVLDGITHKMTHAGNVMDIVYQFLTGGDTSPVQTVWTGFATNNDVITLSAWNHVGSAWETIGLFTGNGGSTNSPTPLILYARHRGTSAAESGKVYIRLNSASTGTVVDTDQLRVEYAVTSRTAGYSGGSIWIDTNGGVAGVEDFVNGVSDNPVLTLVDAETIAASVGVPDFHLFNGSSIDFSDLAGTAENESFFGDHWTLDLGSKACGGIYVEGATVSGIGTSSGEEMHFEGCDVGIASVQRGHFDKCGFNGTLTMTLAADYDFHNCYSKGDTAPIFTKTAGQAIVAEFQNYLGDITISGLQSGDTVELGGFFRTITISGAAGAIVHVHGHYESISSGGFSGTLEITGAIKTTDIAAILVDTDATIPGLIGSLNNLSAANILTQVNAALDTAIVELGVAAPTNTPTIRTALMLQYMALVNQTIVNTSAADELQIHNAAGTKITSKALTDDGSDYTEAKMA